MDRNVQYLMNADLFRKFENKAKRVRTVCDKANSAWFEREVGNKKELALKELTELNELVSRVINTVKNQKE